MTSAVKTLADCRLQSLPCTTSTYHLQETRQHTTSLMCYIQCSIKTTWTAAHTIFIISIHSYTMNVRLLEMSPQPTHSMRHQKHFVTTSQTSSCRCCNKSQHLHLHPQVHGPYTLSSCTLFCHDSPLQSQSLVFGSAELWSISGQGSDMGYHQLYLLHQYSPVEPKNQNRCHQQPAQHTPNKPPSPVYFQQ